MSKEAQRKYLTSRMNENINKFSFPIALPNQPFDIPVNLPYGEFHIILGPEPVIIGGEGKAKVRVRYVGFVQLNVWIPKEKGIQTASVAEDVFKDLFQFHQSRDDVGGTYKFKAIQSYTPETKQGWECISARVPFERDSIERVTISN